MASSDLLTLYTNELPGNSLLTELPVSPMTAPYLVTSPRGLYWQPKSKGGLVRAAVRTKVTLEELYSDIIKEIAFVGCQNDWGNVLPCADIQKGFDFLDEFDIIDIEILTNKEQASLFEDSVVVDWMPSGYTCLVSKDRDVLGVAITTTQGICALLHNPSRSIVILTDVPADVV